MRYYGQDYLDSIVGSITSAYNATDPSNYSLPIRRSTVDPKRADLQQTSVNIAQNAFLKFTSVRNKLLLLQDTLTQFYGEVDATGDSISRMTAGIESMIREYSNVINQLCDQLNGVGNYKGVCVTAQNIARINPDQWIIENKPHDFWKEMVDTELRNGRLNEKAVHRFLDEHAKKINVGVKYDASDRLRLQKILDYYMNDRYGKTNDVRDLEYQRLHNCIDLFEMLYPEAKDRCDRFFELCYSKNDEIIEDNVLLIKYILYTAPSSYRDLILYYMPSIKVTDCTLPPDEEDAFSPYKNTIKLNLTASERGKYNDGRYIIDFPCSVFFHEIGHGIDDVTDKGKMSCSSDILHDELVADLKSHMNGVLNEAGYSLDKKDKKELFDFIVSRKNINVIPPEGKSADYFFPKDWSDDQKKAFDYLRNYYGYREYEYRGVDGYATACDVRPSTAGFSEGGTQDSGTLNDIVGAITNNQFGAVSGHFMMPISDTDDVKSADDLVKKLSRYSYWYNEGLFFKLGDNTEQEFFANMFSNNVLGADMTLTPEVFKNSCNTYDKLIKDLHDSKVPEKYQFDN